MVTEPTDYNNDIFCATNKAYNGSCTEVKK